MVDARYRAVLGWFGIGGILYAVVAYDESVAFPGTAAMLPVLATVLVIAAGGYDPAPSGPTLVLGRAPMLWIGRHSYAIYLWHWPVLVLAEARWGPLTMVQRIVAVALAVLLSAVSKSLVEDRVRTSAGLVRYPGRSVVLGLGLSALAILVGLTSVLVRPRLDSGELANAPELVVAGEAADDSDDEPTGESPRSVEMVTPTGPQLLATLESANRAVLEEALLADDVPANLRPSVASVYDDRPAVYPDGCVNQGVDDTLHDCRYGAVGSDRSIVLYGDSHAAQWAPVMDTIASDAGYELIVLAKGGCPTADVSIATNTLGRTCPAWRDRVVDFVADERPVMVVVSAWHDYDNDDEEWEAGLEATLRRFVGNTSHLVLLADSPGAAANPQQCLSSNTTSMQACTNSRERAVETGRIEVERAVAELVGSTYVDPSDWFCTDDRCPMTLGDVLLFRDADHITTTGAEWFRPLLEAALRPILEPEWLETERIRADAVVDPAS